MKYSLGYIASPNKTEAKAVVLELLERGLIACANILPGAESFYVWEDGIQHEREVVIIIKTIQPNEAEIIQVVRQMHSYDCPCIVFLPISNGNRDFLKWIKDSC